MFWVSDPISITDNDQNDVNNTNRTKHLRASSFNRVAYTQLSQKSDLICENDEIESMLSDSERDLFYPYINNSDKNKEKWKKRVPWILLAVLLAVLIIVGFVFLLRSRNSTGTQNERSSSMNPIELDDILHGRFYVRTFNGTWVSDTEIQYRDEESTIYLYDVVNQTKKILLPYQLVPLGTSAIYLSADKNYLLIEKNPRKLYRYSYLAEYLILNLETNVLGPLKHAGKPSEFQLVKWAPKGHSLVYVKDNNIFYLETPSANGNARQLTATGIFGIIYHGIPDWVYEEEIFNSNSALWFSPDGKKLAFASFNDSETAIMPIPFYGQPGDLRFQYPLEQRIRYPKAGTPNPIVSLSVVDLEKLIIQDSNIEGVTKPQNLNPANVIESFQNKYSILSSVTWANDNELIVVKLNRNQNESKIASFKIDNETSSFLVKKLVETHGWIAFESLKFNKNGTHFALIKGQLQNSGQAFPHVTVLERKENGSTTIVTNGTYEVVELLSWNPKDDKIYFTATTAKSPAEQHVYRVNVAPFSSPECITCSLKLKDNKTVNDCLFNVATLSEENSYFIWSCEGPDIPQNKLIKMDGFTEIMTWEDNAKIKQAISTKSLPTTKMLEVPVTSDLKAQVKLFLPPDMDTSGRTKYPLLIKVYGGPGSNLIKEKFSIDWEHYLVTSKNMIVAAIDGRGSGLKGNNMTFAGYRNFGTVEIYDQINVTRYLQNTFKYIDKYHTAIWGWSYGGYATGMVLATDTKNVFKCGISVAPVTDWALYDSIYTERYMGQPTKEDNALGYERASLLNKVEGLRNKEYLLVHGTMDDNVHYQQSMMLARVLEKDDIIFQQLSYPDEDHGLLGVRRHLYHSLEHFLNECFEIKN